MKMNKQIIGLIVGLLMAIANPVSAQSGLQVDLLFHKLERAKGCKMVVINDGNLRGYSLHIYKALTYKTQRDVVQPYLQADRKHAKKIREVVDNGIVMSGYYMMQPAGKYNRYILFSNGKGLSGTVIYIEGQLSPDDILKLCYVRK